MRKMFWLKEMVFRTFGCQLKSSKVCPIFLLPEKSLKLCVTKEMLLLSITTAYTGTSRSFCSVAVF